MLSLKSARTLALGFSGSLYLDESFRTSITSGTKTTTTFSAIFYQLSQFSRKSPELTYTCDLSQARLYDSLEPFKHVPCLCETPNLRIASEYYVVVENCMFPLLSPTFKSD